MHQWPKPKGGITYGSIIMIETFLNERFNIDLRKARYFALWGTGGGAIDCLLGEPIRGDVE